MASQIITYLRFSTGPARAFRARFAETEGFGIAREFVEVETGKGWAQMLISFLLHFRPLRPEASPLVTPSSPKHALLLSGS
jgi:hypothetical protein